MSRCAAAWAGCVAHRPGVCASTASAHAGVRIAASRRIRLHCAKQPPYSRRPRHLHSLTASVVGAQQVRGAPAVAPANLAVFVSGGGSNFRAIQEACAAGAIKGRVAVVVTNAPQCGGAQYAERLGIPVLVYPSSKSAKGCTPDELVAALREEHGVDYIVLAGYLKLIPPQLVRAFPRAMLNIHPGLLPAFGGSGLYGLRVHSAVIASGARLSGPTVHFVDEGYDTGPILAQVSVPVSPLDSPQQLAARVLAEEHKLYPRCVAALCEGRISWREDGIPIMWTAA
ncbi:hypothetical protein ACKKBF_B32485 [Auxenochlorella protothecoides x Auxenochlorella symbiontica]